VRPSFYINNIGRWQ